MRASPADQLLLLDLQAHDSGLDRLAARRRSLPALAVLADAEKELAGLEHDIVLARTDVTDLGRAQRKLEDDVDAVRARAERDRVRRDTGAVGTARELESLTSEIESLRRRQSDLEDQLLELMEQREGAERRLGELEERAERVRETAGAATEERDREFAAIDVETARVRGDRDALADRVPTDLRRLYERLRADRGGTGAAALTRRRCEGCHLELSGAELVAARDAAPDEVLRCEQCGRILVRTTESGL